jgi:hypothetical protein
MTGLSSLSLFARVQAARIARRIACQALAVGALPMPEAPQRRRAEMSSSTACFADIARRNAARPGIHMLT